MTRAALLASLALATACGSSPTATASREREVTRDVACCLVVLACFVWLGVRRWRRVRYLRTLAWANYGVRARWYWSEARTRAACRDVSRMA